MSEELSDVEEFDRAMAAEMGPEPDWMQLTVVAPLEVCHAVREFLELRFGFRDIAPIDWCVLQRREDYAQVDYAPCEPITTNRYVVDWRKGEGRGDVPVRLGFDVDPGGKH